MGARADLIRMKISPLGIARIMSGIREHKPCHFVAALWQLLSLPEE